MSTGSLAQGIAVRGALPRLTAGIADTIGIGFLAPLSGPVQSWGLPGLNGSQIWTDSVNRAGGLAIGGRRRRYVLCLSIANMTPPWRARGAKACSGQQRSVPADARRRYPAAGHRLPDRSQAAYRHAAAKRLVARHYLIAPSESHPIYNVTGIDWLARQRPNLKRIALCAQTDALGLPSLATYRAACEAAGMKSCARFDTTPTVAMQGRSSPR